MLKNSLSKDEIRVRQAFRYPVDPLLVTSMSDYDLSLLLFRTWFDYDDGRIAKPDLISSWTFDPEHGIYEFKISLDAKWSDGESVRPDDLRRNLSRAIENDTTYGHAIAESINLKSFKTISSNSFSLRTKDGKPSESFFQRLGSIFLAVASPEDFPEKAGRLKSNRISGGAYELKAESADELRFEINSKFVTQNKKAAQTITVRKPDPSFDLMKFLDEETWENYVQMSSLIPDESAKKLISSKLPYWTRGHDRISLLSPVGKGPEVIERREILQVLGWEIQSSELPAAGLNVIRAESLQPVGYPLFNSVKLPTPNIKLEPGKTIRIFAQANYAGEFQKKIILEAANKIGLRIEWIAVDAAYFFSNFEKNSGCDFLLIGFGVADPEPTTWMGLVFSDNNFISFDQDDKDEFIRVSGLKSKTDEIAGYKTLLTSLALRGAYFPLLHLSTLSIGHKNLNFSNIKGLDETVNLGKVILE